MEAFPNKLNNTESNYLNLSKTRIKVIQKQKGLCVRLEGLNLSVHNISIRRKSYKNLFK